MSYYAILGVPSNASKKEIQQAYRRLAKKYHPDSHPGKRVSADKFKAITQAYDILSDDSKRQQYDSTIKQQQNDPFVQAGINIPELLKRHRRPNGHLKPPKTWNDVFELGVIMFSAYLQKKQGPR